jgi:3-hydroxyisobutyrate dehydrogenase-like beta-hydroxyacid dehydrogenase
MKLKMIANYLVAVHNAATAEALVLAERANLDLELVLAAIGDSAGQSKMWQIRGPRMVTADYSPMMSMHLWQKDMGIISQFVADSPYSEIYAPCVIQSHLGGLNASKLPSFPTEHLATNDLRRLDLSSLIP